MFMIRLSIALSILGFIGYITLAHAETPRMQDNDEVECLALNIYHEARSESVAGQYAVADVTLNRVQDRRYPSTICGVVKQAVLSQWGLDRGLEIPRRNMCQFSWYCDGLADEPLETYSWLRAKDVARDMIFFRKYNGITEGSTHYHANYVNPSWSTHERMRLVGRIGDHIFYKEG
jgi:spore germination cell wall hydrolase CwlJ-like protein